MATEDILINDGDSFVSLSALAAEQVEAKLPIESEDGTVILSDSSGSFVVSTGGKERLTVSDDAVSSSVAIKTPSVTGVADNDAEITLQTSASIYAQYGIVLVAESDKDSALINFKNGSGFSYVAGIGTSKEFEIAANTTSPAFAKFRLSTDCTLTNGDGTAWEPRSNESIITKKTVDDKIWVGTSAEYAAISPKLSGTLYCLTD